MDIPFATLLYRYFFFAWLFEDTGRGDMLRRAAAWQYNKQQSRWLPRYIKRYAVTGALLFIVGALAEPVSPLLSVFLYIPSAISVPMGTVAAICWVGLNFRD